MFKLQIKENSKEPDIVFVDHYDAEETYQMMMEKSEHGERKNEFMVFGKNIYSTINIQSIKVLEEPPIETKTEQLPNFPEEVMPDE